MNYSNFLTVRELTVLIKYNLENDIRFKNILVKGEISNLKIHPSGHWYFTLKDKFSRISAVMFSSYAKNVKIRITEGMQVILTGSIGVYENGGSYQLYVNNIQPDGIGTLYLQFEELKRNLEKEGLFDPKYKKPLPKYPMRIGVISASSGAAIHDIFTTITRRWPISERILIPASVQGLSAAPTIVNALKLADTLNFDVIILARGGGSLEDLWPFNEEIVARAIFEMKTPVVSGVGHEVDFTISDFVSDKRAPTPTGAAEMVTPDINEIRLQVNNLKSRVIDVETNKQDKTDPNISVHTSSATSEERETTGNVATALNSLDSRLDNQEIINESQQTDINDLKNAITINYRPLGTMHGTTLQPTLAEINAWLESEGITELQLGDTIFYVGEVSGQTNSNYRRGMRNS